MPFNILSQGVEPQLPQGVTFGPSPAFNNDVQVEQMPAVDASGGSLQVVGTSRLTGSQTDVDLVYTAADGTTVEQTVTLEGYNLGFSINSPAVAYGENLDSFLLSVDTTEYVNQGGIDAFYYHDAYVISVEDTGFEARSVEVLFDSFDDGRFSGKTPYLTPLGDGRVSRVVESAFESDTGIFYESDGVDVVKTLSFDAALATDEGGIVTIFETETGDFAIKQYDADYELTEHVTLTRATLFEQSGLYTQDPTFTFFVNDSGNLDVYLTDPADPDSEIYKIEYDLVPLESDETFAIDTGEDLRLTDGDDVFDIGEGSDTVDGYFGDDLITETPRVGNGYTKDRDEIYGGHGNDAIILSDGRDLIYGGRDDDFLDGGDATNEPPSETYGNTIYGDEGNDTLLGGLKKDDLYGGSDDDTLFGGGSDDALVGGTGNDKAVGGVGSDAISGGYGNDLLRGSDGNDIIAGDDGADLIFGGIGTDILEGGQGFDQLIGGAGDDSLFGGRGEDVLNGGNGNDHIDGGSSDDNIRGGDGNDKVLGGDGDDVINGGSGADLLRGSAGNDVLFGDNGADLIFGGADNDILEGGQGYDTLVGGQGDDSLYGGRGKDVLNGGDGDDYIVGGSSNDNIHGGDGDDLMTGGAGADLYFYNFDLEDDLPVNEGTDTITDFTSGVDSFWISTNTELTFDDLFLSQEESAAVIQYQETTIRLENVDANGLSEDDFLFS
ncbi:MAG: hypothetical protein KIH44_009735 [Octadecabacter sp.]|nr:hypothetical protein [Octadecabacter sp.]